MDAAVPISRSEWVAARAAGSEGEREAGPGQEQRQGVPSSDLGGHDRSPPADRVRRQAIEDRFALVRERNALCRGEGGLRAIAKLAVARGHEHDAAAL